MKYTTRCNIPDPQTHEPCGVDIVITSGIPPQRLGDDSEKKARAYVSAIMQHMKAEHPKLLAGVVGASVQYLGYMLTGYCRTEDPGVLQFMAMFGGHLADVSALRMSDDALAELTARMGLTMEDPQRQKVISMLAYVRDFTSRKAPRLPAEMVQAG